MFHNFQFFSEGKGVQPCCFSRLLDAETTPKKIDQKRLKFDVVQDAPFRSYSRLKNEICTGCNRKNSGVLRFLYCRGSTWRIFSIYPGTYSQALALTSPRCRGWPLGKSIEWKVDAVYQRYDHLKIQFYITGNRKFFRNMENIILSSEALKFFRIFWIRYLTSRGDLPQPRSRGGAARANVLLLYMSIVYCSLDLPLSPRAVRYITFKYGYGLRRSNNGNGSWSHCNRPGCHVNWGVLHHGSKVWSRDTWPALVTYSGVMQNPQFSLLVAPRKQVFSRCPNSLQTSLVRSLFVGICFHPYLISPPHPLGGSTVAMYACMWSDVSLNPHPGYTHGRHLLAYTFRGWGPSDRGGVEWQGRNQGEKGRNPLPETEKIVVEKCCYFRRLYF